MVRERRKTRLQRKRDKDSLLQASKYLLLIFAFIYLMVKLGLPALIKMATFIGDINSSNKPVEKEDQIAPTPPQLFPLPEATNSSQIDIKGYAEAGSSINLFIGGLNLEETVVDNQGQFKFEGVHLREGENEIYTLAKDEQGNSSPNSPIETVIVDTEKPELAIATPKNGDQFFDKDNQLTVQGTTEAGASISVNGHWAVVAANGDFSSKLELKEGDNQIEVRAKDEAGNTSVQIIKVNYLP